MNQAAVSSVARFDTIINENLVEDPVLYLPNDRLEELDTVYGLPVGDVMIRLNYTEMVQIYQRLHLYLSEVVNEFVHEVED